MNVNHGLPAWPRQGSNPGLHRQWCRSLPLDYHDSFFTWRAERAKNEQFPFFIPRATARCGHRGIRTMPGLHPEGGSLLVTPGGDYMDSMILGCGPAGLRQSRCLLGKCSSCDAQCQCQCTGLRGLIVIELRFIKFKFRLVSGVY